MDTLRTRFKKDILCEFLPPLETSTPAKVIIFCGGMPSVPSKQSFMEFFAKKGFWIFFPRYRGTWESSGQFLSHSPEYDIKDVIDGLSEGFTEVESQKKYKLNTKKIYLIGGSFGGPAVLLNSIHPKIEKVIAFCPVVDWQSPSKTERLSTMYRSLKNAFGEAYRLTEKNWNKLSSGTFYNPATELKKINAKKILLIHSKDDEVVSYDSVKKFSKLTQTKLITLKTAGHISSKLLTRQPLYKKIQTFLNS